MALEYLDADLNQILVDLFRHIEWVIRLKRNFFVTEKCDQIIY